MSEKYLVAIVIFLAIQSFYNLVTMSVLLSIYNRLVRKEEQR